MKIILSVEMASQAGPAFWTASGAAREWIHCNELVDEDDVDILVTDSLDSIPKHKLRSEIVVLVLPHARRLKLRAKGIFAAKNHEEDLRKSLLRALDAWHKTCR